MEALEEIHNTESSLDEKIASKRRRSLPNMKPNRLTKKNGDSANTFTDQDLEYLKRHNFPVGLEGEWKSLPHDFKDWPQISIGTDGSQDISGRTFYTINCALT